MTTHRPRAGEAYVKRFGWPELSENGRGALRELAEEWKRIRESRAETAQSVARSMKPKREEIAAHWENATGWPFPQSIEDYRELAAFAGFDVNRIDDLTLAEITAAALGVLKRMRVGQNGTSYSREMTKQQIARLLGVSVKTVSRRIEDGKLDVIEESRQGYRVRLDQLPPRR